MKQSLLECRLSLFKEAIEGMHAEVGDDALLRSLYWEVVGRTLELYDEDAFIDASYRLLAAHDRGEEINKPWREIVFGGHE